MGMFDSVYAKCPKCGAEVEFQSKAGECHLINCPIDAVPVAIALDITGDVEQCACGTRFRLVPMPRPPTTVKMHALAVD